VSGTVLSRRLAAGLGAPGDGRPIQGVCRDWRLAVRRDPPGGRESASYCERRWRLAVREYRQAVWSNFAWRQVGRARRKRCCSLLGVLFLTDNDALLGSGDAVP